MHRYLCVLGGCVGWAGCDLCLGVVWLGFFVFVGCGWPVVSVVGIFCDCVCMHVSLGSVPSAREVFENLRVIARRRYGFTDVLF